jgi:hypothetical protein
METYYIVLILVICFGLLGFIIWVVGQIHKLQDEQSYLGGEIRTSLRKRGFNIDKTVNIELPDSRYYLNPNWVPAVYCFLFIDYENKKWAISYNQKREPEIYDFEDFREADLDVNGKPAGNTGLNALIGALVVGAAGAAISPTYHSFDGVFHTYTNPGAIGGALLGAALAAALTRKYGLVKGMSLKIRMKNKNDQFMTIPIITAPYRGLRDTDKGLEFVMDFISKTNDAFEYIKANS